MKQPVPSRTIDAEIQHLLDVMLGSLEQEARGVGLPNEALGQLRQAFGQHVRPTAEATLQTLLEAVPDAVVTVDADGRIVQINELAQQMFGYSREEAIGREVELLLPEGLRAGHVKHRQRFMTAPTARPMEARQEFSARRKDGREFRVEISLSPMWIQGGLLVSAAVRDITQRKQAEEAMHRSEERFHLLVEGAKEYALFLLDPEGNIVSWNSGAERIKGYTAQEIIGRSFCGCYTPEDAAQGKPQRALQIAARDGRYEGECWVVRKDGSRFWANTLITALRNEDGSLRGYAELARDITEQRLAQEALRESHATLHSLVDANIIGIIQGEEDRITQANDLFLKMLGYTREEVAAGMLRWPELTPPEYATADRQALEELAANGASRPFEKEYIRKDGTRVPVLIGVVRLNEHPLRWICYVNDIRERKRIELEREQLLEQARIAKEQAEQANRAKDQFLAVLSHELRTPLAPVLATIALIESKADLPSDVRDEVYVIHRNVELEARLIDDLLDLTRISRGKIELHHEILDLHTAVQQALEICQTEIQGRKLEVSMSLWAERHWVWADPGRIQQVLWNLLKNAIKFTPEHGRLSLKTSDSGDGRLRMEIGDTGVGIEPELLPRLFTAFEQGSKDTTRQFGGLGLGLAISKAIVDLHGGTISASSEGRNKGATFTVELATTEATASAMPAPRAPAKPKGRKLTILFVEDNDDTRRVMAQLLRASGYSVKTAASVREASEMLEKGPIDLLVSDLGLPDGTGYDIMRHVRQHSDIKGIALSGYGMEEDIARSMESGFSRHLTKPVKPQELNAVISELVPT